MQKLNETIQTFEELKNELNYKENKVLSLEKRLKENNEINNN